MLRRKKTIIAMKLQLDVFIFKTSKIEFCLLVEKMATFVLNTDSNILPHHFRL